MAAWRWGLRALATCASVAARISCQCPRTLTPGRRQRRWLHRGGSRWLFPNPKPSIGPRQKLSNSAAAQFVYRSWTTS